MGLLFVYGTLKSGERNHDCLDGTFVRSVRTKPNYKLVNCGTYPGLVRGDLAIAGELYEVDDVFLQRLDYFEGINRGVYVRELIQLEDDTEAFAYVYQLDSPEYEGTDWHERRSTSVGEPLLSL